VPVAVVGLNGLLMGIPVDRNWFGALSIMEEVGGMETSGLA